MVQVGMAHGIIRKQIVYDPVIQSGYRQGKMSWTEVGLYLLLFPPDEMIRPVEGREGRATYGTHFLLWMTTLL